MAPNDILLEPGKAYKEYYKEKHKQNANDLLDELIKKSGMNVEENRKLSAEYRVQAEEAGKVGSKLSKFKGLRTFLIILVIIGIILMIVGIYKEEVALAVVSPIVSVGVLLVIFLVLNKKIKALKAGFDALSQKANELHQKAMASIAPLLSLFRREMTHELIMKTMPEVTIDRCFSPKRFDYLNGKYGYSGNVNPETSTVGVLSGELMGNAFLFERRLCHSMGKQAYVGSLTIHWVTYSRDSNGRTVPHHHTQVLHATVVKPRPFYSNQTSLVFSNDAAPDLSFTHSPSHAERMSERALKSAIKSGVKKARKEAKKRMSEGFTEMGNEEFEGLFGGLDRNHEVQYRLLYTALAQKNTLGLMKGESPYGDDFRLEKRKGLNYVISEHAQTWRMETDPAQYHSYDVDICRQLFVELNSDYFSNMYFDFAPLLAIPMYQQYAPTAYQYKESYSTHFTVQEAESIANRIGGNAFSHPASATPAILKAQIVSSDKEADYLCVTAFSYRVVHRVDFIPVLGGDGRIHAVPVPWLQYIPITKTGNMKVKALDIDEKEYADSDFAGIAHPHAFFNGLFAVLESEGEMTDSAPEEQDTDVSEYGGVVESNTALDEGEAPSGNTDDGDDD